MAQALFKLCSSPAQALAAVRRGKGPSLMIRMVVSKENCAPVMLKKPKKNEEEDQEGEKVFEENVYTCVN